MVRFNKNINFLGLFCWDSFNNNLYQGFLMIQDLYFVKFKTCTFGKYMLEIGKYMTECYTLGKYTSESYTSWKVYFLKLIGWYPES